MSMVDEASRKLALVPRADLAARILAIRAVCDAVVLAVETDVPGYEGATCELVRAFCDAWEQATFEELRGGVA